MLCSWHSYSFSVKKNKKTNKHNMTHFISNTLRATDRKSPCWPRENSPKLIKIFPQLLVYRIINDILTGSLLNQPLPLSLHPHDPSPITLRVQNAHQRVFTIKQVDISHKHGKFDTWGQQESNAKPQVSSVWFHCFSTLFMKVSKT